MIESHNVSDKTWITMLHNILMKYSDIKSVNNAYLLTLSQPRTQISTSLYF